MWLSLSSIINAVICTSVFALLFVLLLNNDGFLRYAGLKTGIVVSVIMGVRLLLPVEFIFTHDISSEQVMTALRSFCLLQLTICNIEIYLYQVLVGVWLIGIVIQLGINGFKYHKLQKFISTIQIIDNECSLTSRVRMQLNMYPELVDVSVVHASVDIGPFLIGLRNKVIVLPNKQFSEEEIGYILGHEAMHIRQKDFIWKIVIDLFSILYWWNPLIARLRRCLFEVLEMNTDMNFTKKMTNDQKIGYLECLRRLTNISNVQNCVGLLSFTNSSVKALKRRVSFIVDGHEKNLFYRVCLDTLIVLSVFLSVFIICEPKYPCPKGMIEGTEMNTYAVQREGKYDIYFNGEYIVTELSLEYYPEGMKIYEE